MKVTESVLGLLALAGCRGGAPGTQSAPIPRVLAPTCTSACTHIYGCIGGGKPEETIRAALLECVYDCDQAPTGSIDLSCWEGTTCSTLSDFVAKNSLPWPAHDKCPHAGRE